MCWETEEKEDNSRKQRQTQQANNDLKNERTSSKSFRSFSIQRFAL